jgi:hypothetical protein
VSEKNTNAWGKEKVKDATARLLETKPKQLKLPEGRGTVKFPSNAQRRKASGS